MSQRKGPWIEESLAPGAWPVAPTGLVAEV